MENENKILAFICIFALSFGYIGWFFAESDNELLLKENKILSSQLQGYHDAHPEH